MGLERSEEEKLLQEAARELVQREAPLAQLRELRDRADGDGFSRALWKQMAELGWVGAIIPENLGGAGLGCAEQGLVMEELGRNLVATPMLGTAVLGASCLLLGASDALREATLPRVARGEWLLAIALDETPHFAPHRVETRAEASGRGFRVSGDKTFVLDGHVADELIVVARVSGGALDRDGLVLLLVGRDAPGLEITRSSMIDARNAARVRLREVKVSAEAVLGEVGAGAELLDATLDRGTALLSAEMLGSAEAAFERTLDYLKVRKQFGAPIGSFQALQHRAARLYAALELSRSLVRDALQAIDEARPEAARCVSAAKAHVAQSFERVASEAIQLHGGIGMTDEHDIGLYYKRSRVAGFTLGDARYHRARFASLSGF